MDTKEQQSDLSVIKTVRKLTRFVRSRRIDYDEYASNVLIHLAGQPFFVIEECFSDASSEESAALARYAKAHLEENDYSPSPTVFMVDTRDPEKVEQVRKEMRPKFEQLLRDLERLVDCV
jgi:hypothetical protein